MTIRFGPTLARRVFLAAVIAYVAVWGAVITQKFATDQETPQQFRQWMEGKSRILDRLATPAQAVAYMDSLSSINQYETDGVPPNCFELWSRDGQRIFFDQKHAYPYPPLTGDPQRMSTQAGNGIDYDIYRVDGARWSLRFAVPRSSLGTYAKIYGAHLNRQLLLAAPILLLLIWFAIVGGLAPLRALSRRLAARAADDLAPLDFDAKYAELKPLASALDALLLLLRSKIEREHAFVQDAAHELQTPLAVILAQAHVLAKAQSEVERQEAIQQIDHAIARAMHLVGQLLELARVDTLRRQPGALLDVAQLARADLAQMAQAAKARAIALSIDAPPSLLHRLEQNTFVSILHNLIDNAIRYGRSGGAVALELKKSGDSLLLSVADDGPGIGLAERDLVFERFYRGAGNQASGSGLGLAIVQQAAAQLGAQVALSDGLRGRGCRFTVLIPAEPRLAA
jgi:signal transduction histidine kinase